jgi:hypothetical protein
MVLIVWEGQGRVNGLCLFISSITIMDCNEAGKAKSRKTTLQEGAHSAVILKTQLRYYAHFNPNSML